MTIYTCTKKYMRRTWALLAPPTHPTNVTIKTMKRKHQHPSNLDLEFLVMAMVILITIATIVPTNKRETKWERENKRKT